MRQVIYVITLGSPSNPVKRVHCGDETDMETGAQGGGEVVFFDPEPPGQHVLLPALGAGTPYTDVPIPDLTLRFPSERPDRKN